MLLEDLLHYGGRFHAGQALVQPLVPAGETAVVNAHAVKDRCVQLIEVHRVFRDVIAEVIGFPVGHPSLDPTAGHPHTEITGMVIASVVISRQFSLAVGGSPELPTENHESVLEHPPFLEVLDKGGSWLVDVKALVLDFPRQVSVLVPAPVKDLYDPDPALDQTTGKEG